MIILVGSQKGGCGKSTLAINISAWLAGEGKDVMLVDADRQATASAWVQEREELKDVAVINSVQKYDNIAKSLQDLDKRYEYVVVDAAGRDSRELRTAMLVAHKMIVPFRPSQADLNTLPKMQEMIVAAQDMNSDLEVFGLLTMAPTNPIISESEEAEELLSEFYTEIPLIDVKVCDRKVYRDGMADGKGVTEMNNPKATNEIRLVAARIGLGE